MKKKILNWTRQKGVSGSLVAANLKQISIHIYSDIYNLVQILYLIRILQYRAICREGYPRIIRSKMECHIPDVWLSL